METESISMEIDHFGVEDIMLIPQERMQKELKHISKTNYTKIKLMIK